LSLGGDHINSFSDPMSGTAVLEAIVDEKRATTRQSLAMTARVVRLGGRAVADGLARDISEGGLFLTVAPSAGLSVGERCELELFEADGSPLGCLAGGSCFATVVRTQVVSTESSDPLVGAGLRFDHPLYL
jgi:PilZ domain